MGIVLHMYYNNFTLLDKYSQFPYVFHKMDCIFRKFPKSDSNLQKMIMLSVL
jgi:hypothetical protein